MKKLIFIGGLKVLILYNQDIEKVEKWLITYIKQYDMDGLFMLITFPRYFTIEESINFARTIKAKTVIPMHYDMYTLNTANVADFISQAEGKLNYKIAQIGVPFLL